MEKREISEDEVIQTITYPKKLTKIEGIYHAQKNIVCANIEVIYEKDIYKGCNILLYMKITFDKEADAVYIESDRGDFASNKKIDNNPIIDVDTNGNIIGIELLNVSKRVPKNFLSRISVENLIPE